VVHMVESSNGAGGDLNVAASVIRKFCHLQRCKDTCQAPQKRCTDQELNVENNQVVSPVLTNGYSFEIGLGSQTNQTFHSA
jgi:hypothetical protein